MRRLLCAALFLTPAIASAQHPRAILDAGTITLIEGKAAGTTVDWLALRGSASGPVYTCDFVTRTTSGTGDSLPPVYAARAPVTYNPPGTVTEGYQGSDFAYTLMNLATCYHAIIDTEPAVAAKYLAQSIKIMQAMSSPFATVAPASPPASWNGLTERPAWYVTNTGPGGQARINLYYQGLSTGATVTLSGVLGCTSANITGKVGTTSTHYFDLTDSGGTPVICNAAGTNYNFNFLNDAGYGVRFYVGPLALAYDWLYDGLDAGTKTQIYATLNKFLDEIKSGYSLSGGGIAYDGDTQGNYHWGYSHSLALTGICTRGAGENSRGQEWYDFWHDTMWDDMERPYFGRWLANDAGFFEGLQYQPQAIFSAGLVAAAQYTANAENLMTTWPWMLGNMRAWMHNTMPPRTTFTERGYMSTGNPLPNPWTNAAMFIIHHLAAINADAFRPKFKQWVEDLTTQNNPAAAQYWWKVVFWDSSLSNADWTVETLSSAQGSNPAGGYVRVLQRSDWTTSGVYGDFMIGPYIDSGWGGQGRRDKGSLLVQRGTANLLVSPWGEAVRQNSSSAYNFVNAYHHYGIFYVTRIASSFTVPPVNGDGDDPGNDRFFRTPSTVTTTMPQRIDRYEDQTSYVYSRGVRLDKNYHYSDTGWKPIIGWDREVLYLRPKVFVVYDRTDKLDRTSPSEPYSQVIAWLSSKTPTTSAYGSGMFRTEVSDGATYKGALTYVLPAGMSSPATTNLGGYNVLYQHKVAPPSETRYVNWLTVVDAADAQGNLASVAPFATRSNVDVIRVGTDTVAGFTSQQNGAAAAFPLTYTMAGMGDSVTHRLCGLAASTTYKRTVSGNDVEIATSGGGTDTVSTAAGCISFTSGAGEDPAVVVDTNTPMPAGTVGVAYSQCFAASGGDGGPYAWTKTVGDFPTDISLASGCITGTPSVAETEVFTMQACDGTPLCGTKELSLTIGANSPAITTTSAPNGVEDVAYATQVCSSGGVTPYAYTLASGTLPTGLSLNDASPCATITGTPTVPGTYNFTLQVEDDLTQTDTQAYQVVISPALVTELSITVVPGSTSALVIFGASGMSSGSTCTVQIKQGEVLIQQNDETLRFAKQRSAFNGLAPSTTYGAVVDCPLSAAQASVTFTTLPLEATSPVTVPIVLKPNALLSTVTQVTLDWGVDDIAENTDTQDCASGCQFDLSLSAGIYVYRYIWKNVGGTAVATSNTRELIVP